MSRADQRFHRGDARYVWGFIETRVMVEAALLLGLALGMFGGWCLHIIAG